MKPSFFHLPENTSDPKERITITLYIIILFLVATAISVMFLIFQVIRTPSPPLLAVFFAVLGALMFEVAGLVITRRGRHELGIWLTFTALMIAATIVTIFVSGLGIALMVVTAASAVMIAMLTLSSRQAVAMSATGIVVAMAIFLADTFNPTTRFAITGFNVVVNILVGVILLLFTASIFRRFPSYSLRGKLIVVFLVVALVPLAVVAIININSSRQSLTDSANQKLYGAAQQTAAQLDEFMRLNIEAVRTEAQMKDVVEYFALPVAERPGSEEELRLQTFFATLVRQNPIYIDSIALLDNRGITIYDTNSSDIGLNRSDRRYFQNVIQTGRPLASDVEFSESSDAASLYFAAPVRDSSGRITAVLRKRFNAAILQKYLTANNELVGEDSFPMLVDDETYIRLAHGNEPTLNFKLIVPPDAAALAQLQAERHLPPGMIEELSTDEPDLKAGLENHVTQPFFLAEFHHGEATLEQGAVVLMKTQPWLVVFAQPQSIFLAPITRAMNTATLAVFALAFIVAGLGFGFSQYLSGPIVRLTRTAEVISGGDLNAQAVVETNDEIGALASAFNRMTAQLRDFITSLEERVVARTKDLATVAEVGTATGAILDTQKLLQQVVELTKERFNLYHSHIYLLDESGKNLVLAAGAGEPGRQMVTEGRSIPLDREQSLVARAARERQGVTVNDVTQAPDFLPNPLLPDTRSELAVPMIVGGNVIGVFDVQSDTVGHFTESDVSIQTTLAAQLATSVQNARSYERTRAQAELESMVNAIGQRIQRAGSVDETLQVAVRELGLALSAPRASVNIQASRQHDGDQAGNN